ncbi:hypothetical protein [Mucilaginibacter flavidus]|nr:hypothetical protein [Mucilaginibacter flavidus]
MISSAIISKVWSFCNTLRDDGVSNGDYLDNQHVPSVRVKMERSRGSKF